jgi:hypothetical protein
MTSQTSQTEAFVGPLPQAAKAKRGRPAKHADAAARQRAWRAANTVKTLSLDGKVGPTIARLAEQFDCTETHVVNNLLRFALANRNWATMGIGGWAKDDKRFASGKRAAPAVDLTALDAEFPLV